METIGSLAKRLGLGRSTLMHYERLGLLSPSGRTEGGYRLYGEADLRRLERIRTFREAGLPLQTIRELLDRPDPEGLDRALEEQLRALNEEQRRVRRRQARVCSLLSREAGGEAPSPKDWVDLFARAGLSREDAVLWHRELERSFPELHHQILAALGYSESDIILRRKGGIPMDATPLATHVFFEAFRNLPRLNPGSRETTLRGLALAGSLPQAPEILELGCGEGTVAMLLAEATGGTVTALDLHQHYLDTLTERARARGLEDRIRPVQGDVAALPFPDHSFDLVWGEGIVFVLGMERALAEWRRLLRPGGWLALSEAFLAEGPLPEEVRTFWERVYPQALSAEENAALFRAAGYRNVGHFVQPDGDWWEPYYTPLGKRLPALREKYQEEPEALGVLAGIQEEIDLRRRWPETYGYVFVTGQV
ncbi:transcriptional regulator, MerR family [Aminomonas paucivorans DSM 12260]|uniref:Transcriptional regulator, MerR family n=1 Tax=Aminomonas paucivorans DSM 12260 TaxID=584708 RepID=E3CUB1_9BACT|nr:methyltransferase domain-containing protein [Aminomonas paucivorans]EFQ23070.1 transcriptional regulator, MerR family [Aminomonas paucivorans DSM 12260]